MGNVINLLLWIINKLNKDPQHYGVVNNVDNYSRSFLDDTASANPDITLKNFLADMDKMDKCIGNCVIKNGIVYQDADLKNELGDLK